MAKQYVVVCSHNNSFNQELEFDVILLTDSIVTAVDVVQKVEKIGYCLAEKEACASVIELDVGRIYTKNDWDNILHNPKICTYHFTAGNLKLHWFCNTSRMKYFEKIKKIA